MKLWICFAGCVAIAASTAWSEQARQLSFEVASIKPNKTSAAGRGGNCHGTDSHYAPSATIVPPPGRCIFINMDLPRLINVAFSRNVPRTDTRILGAPAWANTAAFNIEAKAEKPTMTRVQLYEMLQTLLVERFKLQFHSVTEEVPGFALVVDKKGPKLAPTKSPNGKPRQMGRVDSLQVTNDTVGASLPGYLETRLRAPVIDKTGLTAKYDFTLKWTPELGPGRPISPNSPTIFTALPEQLGLKLERQKVPVEFLVIDHVEQPKPNER